MEGLAQEACHHGWSHPRALTLHGTRVALRGGTRLWSWGPGEGGQGLAFPGPPSRPHVCSYRLRESPKLSQANGTPGVVLASRSRDGSPDPGRSKGAGKGDWVGNESGRTPPRPPARAWGQASVGGSSLAVAGSPGWSRPGRRGLEAGVWSQASLWAGLGSGSSGPQGWKVEGRGCPGPQARA